MPSFVYSIFSLSRFSLVLLITILWLSDLSFTNVGCIASSYIIVKSPRTEKTVRLIIKNFFRIEADFFCFIS